MDISKVTPYQDVNNVLLSMAQGIERILGNNLLGLYLCGSLSYGDFNPESSDIDLVAMATEKQAPRHVAQDRDERVGDGDLRIFLYNIPQMSGVAIGPSLVSRLIGAYGPVIAGLKDSSGSWDSINR